MVATTWPAQNQTRPVVMLKSPRGSLSQSGKQGATPRQGPEARPSRAAPGGPQASPLDKRPSPFPSGGARCLCGGEFPAPSGVRRRLSAGNDPAVGPTFSWSVSLARRGEKPINPRRQPGPWIAVLPPALEATSRPGRLADAGRIRL